MSAMKQLEDTLMTAPINDLAAIFLRRLMMQLEISKINDAVLHDIFTHLENEIGNRLCQSPSEHGFNNPEVIYCYD